MRYRCDQALRCLYSYACIYNKTHTVGLAMAQRVAISPILRVALLLL